MSERLPTAHAPLDREALPAPGLPLYLRLARHLHTLIDANTIGNDGILPPERDLANRFGLSRVTVRKALQELESQGLLDIRHGAGSFIRHNPRVEQKLSTLTGFSEDMVSRGMVASARWISRSTGQATPEEALSLDLSPGSMVSRLKRLRLANGVPMALEHSVLPARYLPDPMQLDGSLYEYLRQNGIAPFRALQRLKAALAENQEAALLELKSGSPVLYIERRTTLENGAPLEFVKSHYRGDVYDFIVELNLNNQESREGPL
jgi:Transcriptional regulators